MSRGPRKPRPHSEADPLSRTGEHVRVARDQLARARQHLEQARKRLQKAREKEPKGD